MGCSSGGSCAIIMAWYHPELYHRVLTYSGTFVNQQWPHNPETPGGAWELHETLIPNSPAKPLRIWMEVGDRDLLNPNVMRDDMHDWVAGQREHGQGAGGQGLSLPVRLRPERRPLRRRREAADAAGGWSTCGRGTTPKRQSSLPIVRDGRKEAKAWAGRSARLDAARDGRGEEVTRLLASGVRVDPRDDRRLPRDVTPMMHAARWPRLGRSPPARPARINSRGTGTRPVRPPGGRRCITPPAAATSRSPGCCWRPGCRYAVGTGSVGTPLDDAIYGDDGDDGAGTRDYVRPRGSRAAFRRTRIGQYGELRPLPAVPGADPNVPDPNGDRPLHGAASRGLPGVATALLDNGADVNCRNELGWTAFSYTARRKHVDVAILLLRRGLDVTLKDRSGWRAALGGTHGQRGTGAGGDRPRCSLNERDDEGRTAFDIAVENRQEAIADLLAKAGGRSGRGG